MSTDKVGSVEGAEGGGAQRSNLPYPRVACAEAELGSLATIGRFFGLQANNLDEPSRVLEIGCASGGNAIPSAMLHPRCTVLGVDVDAEAVEEAQRARKELEVRNVNFLHADARNLADGLLGSFDYVIMHGVLSWVPADVRAGLLETVSACLAPNGVAFISHDVMPGCSVRMALREMMRRHVGTRFADPTVRVGQARALAKLVTSHVPVAWLDRMEAELATLDGSPDGLVAAEYLAETCEPMWLEDLVEEAGAAGLTWLCDAADAFEGNKLAAPGPDAKLGAILDKVAGSDAVRREAYLDYVQMREFRRSVFARKGVGRIDVGVSRRGLLGGSGESGEVQVLPRSTRPEAWAYTRWLVENEEPYLVNLRMENSVPESDVLRQVIRLADGTRDVEELEAALRAVGEARGWTWEGPIDVRGALVALEAGGFMVVGLSEVAEGLGGM